MASNSTHKGLNRGSWKNCVGSGVVKGDNNVIYHAAIGGEAIIFDYIGAIRYFLSNEFQMVGSGAYPYGQSVVKGIFKPEIPRHSQSKYLVPRHGGARLQHIRLRTMAGARSGPGPGFLDNVAGMYTPFFTTCSSLRTW